MQKKTQVYRQRIPGAAGKGRRHLFGAYQRALALCASMESAEHHIIAAVVSSHILGIPQEKFQAALRRFKRPP